MKNRYSKKRYKLQAGIQRIEMDTPDYSKAYEIQAEQNAKNKGISQAAGMFSGAYAPIGQVGGMAGDVIRNRAKNKKTGATVGGAVEMGASGAALGAQLGGPWGAAAGLVVGGTYGAIKGAKDYEKVKTAAQEEERKVETANFNKQFVEGNRTDAQSFVARKGKSKIKSKKKYKVNTKQPRLIETEGREPIFSPKKPDGTRDLLYYNPNDPTHEEGGVKAMVIPKAQGGKRKTKAAPITLPGMKRPAGESDEWNPGEIRDPAKRKAPTVFGLMNPTDEAWRKNYRKEDSPIEDAAEIFDLTGITAHDDLQRSIEAYKNLPKNASSFDKGLYGLGVGMDAFAATPIIGKGAIPFKISRWALAKGLRQLPKGEKLANAIYKTVQKEAVPAAKGLWGKTKSWAGKNLNRVSTSADEFQDYDRAQNIYNYATGKKNDEKAYGAKQLKVSNLNDAALSQNFAGMPAANAANKFMQPIAGKMQVARQIPENRRKEKIKTKRSHKKSTGPVKTVEPPMLYEMKPPPPRSTYNTKNDFADGTKKLNLEKERKADSARYAQNIYSAAKTMANKNMVNVVTEKRPGNKNYGKKTGANTCLTAACAVNKMTGTNIPFDLTKSRNSDPRVGDNALETRYNPAFLKNHKNLGYKLLTENDKMQPGDLMQVKKSGRPTHAKVFLGNAKGPLIAEDHGESQDDFGLEISHEDYRKKYNTVKDAKEDGYGWVYRYMGLPKKESESKKVKVYK